MLARSIQSSSCNKILRKSFTVRCISHQQQKLLLYHNNNCRFQYHNKKKNNILTTTSVNYSSSSLESEDNNKVHDGNVEKDIIRVHIVNEDDDGEDGMNINSSSTTTTTTQSIKERNKLHEYQEVLLQLSNANKLKDAIHLLTQMPKLQPDPIYPDASCYNIVLKSCIDNDNIDNALDIFELLQTQNSNDDENENKRTVVLDVITINTILHGLANYITKNDNINVEKYYDKVNDIFNTLKRPNTSSYNALLKIQFIHNNNTNNSSNIPNILKEMKNNDIRSDEYTHAIIVHGYTKIGYIKEAYSYLSIILEQTNSDSDTSNNKSLQISIHPFGILIHELAKRNDVNGAISVFNKIPKQLKPHGLIYNSLIDVHCRTNYDIPKAENLLHSMIHDSKVTGINKDIYPSYFCFSSIITSYSKFLQPDKACNVLKTMIALHLDNGNDPHGSLDKSDKVANTDLTPTLQLCNSILSSYMRIASNSSRNINNNTDNKAPFKAKALLQEMIKLSNNTIPTLDPDIRSYTNVMLAFINSKSLTNDNNMLKREIFQLYYKMIKSDQDPTSNVTLDSQAYNVILNAMAKCCITSSNNKNSNSNNIDNNNDIIKIVKDVLHKMTTDDKVKPDIISYNSIINSFAKIGAADTAHKLLSNLLESTSSIKPDVYTFNIVLHAYATSCRMNPQMGYKHAQLAEDLLNSMMSDFNTSSFLPLPDSYSFNSVIDAWSRADIDDRGERAERILNLMMDQYTLTGNEHCKPDLRSYLGVIHGYGKSNKISNAESIFHKLQNETLGIKLNTIAYNSIINVIGKCRDRTIRNKANKAYQYLQEMKTNNIPCDILTYNFALSACSFTSTDGDEKKIAFNLAKDIMHLLFHDNNNRIEPEDYTFVILLDVYTNLLPYSKMNDNSDYVQEVFRNACERGLISDYVLSKLKKVLDVEDYNRLIPRAIPLKWRRNVGKNKRRR